jgi:hypothetical protein
MTHDEAKKSMAAEAYILDDLEAAERNAFEEHFFDCTDCTSDVLDAATIADGVRMRTNVVPFRTRFNWWAVAASVLAAGLGYQNLVVMPRIVQTAESRPANSELAHIIPPGQTIAAASRGDDTTTRVVVARAGQPVHIDFPFFPSIPGPYFGEIRDAAGNKVTKPFAVAESPDLIPLLIPADTLHTGSYTLIIRGAGGENASEYRFNVRSE